MSERVRRRRGRASGSGRDKEGTCGLHVQVDAELLRCLSQQLLDGAIKRRNVFLRQHDMQQRRREPQGGGGG